MSRFPSLVENLRRRDERAFVPFVVLGDPTPELSLRLIDALVDAGADALELGLPFSDPPADGPAIQAASRRALTAGATTARSLALVAALRRRHALPVSLLGYLNPLLQRGLDAFYAQAADAGVDAVLVADVPLEESAPLVEAARRHRVDPIFIASERSDAARLDRLARVACGYLYVVAHLGVTGERSDLPVGLTAALARMRARVPLPLLAGFGFSTPDQVRAARHADADGVVCGSAIARRIEAHLADPEALLAEVHRFASSMKQATRPAPSRSR